MNLTSEKFDLSGLIIYQPATGHRYGEESLALANFVKVRPGVQIVELGSGVGIISLLIAAHSKPIHIDAVELQPSVHEIAKKNVSENGYDHIIKCINDDYRNFVKSNSDKYDVVISNPPFFTATDGRLSPDPQRAAARHELNGTVEDLTAAAHKLLKPSGKFLVVFDSRRNDELRDVSYKVGFKETKIKTFDEAAFVLVEFTKSS